MRTEGFLGQTERQIAWLESTGLSSAQQMDPIHYEPGQVIEFCRRAKGGFKSGERWEVSRKRESASLLPARAWKTFCTTDNGKRSTSTGWDTMQVAVGEHLLITKNNRGANLRNGEPQGSGDRRRS